MFYSYGNCERMRNWASHTESRKVIFLIPPGMFCYSYLQGLEKCLLSPSLGWDRLQPPIRTSFPEVQPHPSRFLSPDTGLAFISLLACREGHGSRAEDPDGSRQRRGHQG